MIFTFELIADKIKESERERGRRVGTIMSEELTGGFYMVKIEGYENYAKVPSKIQEKLLIGDIIRMEPAGFDNRLEITGRTGGKRYSEGLLKQQLEQLLSGKPITANDISVDVDLPGVFTLQQLIDYLLKKIN